MATETASESAASETAQAPRDNGNTAQDTQRHTTDGDADMLSLGTVVGELRGYLGDITESWGSLDPEDRGRIQRVVRDLRRATEGATAAPPADRLPAAPAGLGWMFAAGILIAMLWLIVFAIGFSVPTAPHLEVLDAKHLPDTSFLAAMKTIAIVIVCSTPTNPGILACLAALLGGVSSWIHVDGSAPNANDCSAPLPRIFLAPMLRGFFMYLTLLGGLLLLTTQAITNATRDQYVQLAGTVSVFAFMIGYDPNVFRKLMGRVNGWAAQRETAEALAEVRADARDPGRTEHARRKEEVAS